MDDNTLNVEDTVCFTGHRPGKLNGYDPKDNKKLLLLLRDIIVNYIEVGNVSTFISGMALGIDIWCAKIVLKLKETYPHIKLICAIPCVDQGNSWPEESQKDWQHIVDRADEVEYVSTSSYTDGCMNERNKWMVDRSNYVLAVWDGTPGGTSHCVGYANTFMVQMVVVHPKTLQVSGGSKYL